ncbi:hypothetical protein [Pleomorphomonas sp. NRK KF1]|uniref:hypothetical protein n=1 Tax=Pleomorphomonas sp. NRK KF1 TaxID=2943000 RepID=UPI0020438128|nr:hypothetical protein [Pleomorphomonas sp. NRK KF1]MCM5555135.1 hypothetical protein [Pleomorphomonas sp. NRK KF1]
MRGLKRLLRKHGLPQKVGPRTLLQLVKLPRNTFTSWLYCKFQARGLQSFLAALDREGRRKVLCVISFNLPWAVDLMIRSCSRFLPDWQLAIFDNSNDKAARAEISAICARYNTPYLGLPKNPEWSPNRSHALALNWVYRNIISVVRPLRFGFLDHDCFPIAPPSIDARLDEQLAYGDLRPSKIVEGVWNLWAGYMFFDGAVIERFHLDFNHDQMRRLDTGGRNWAGLYRHLPREKMSFATSSGKTILSHNLDVSYALQCLDLSFCHVGGASYDHSDAVGHEYVSSVRDFLENIS